MPIDALKDEAEELAALENTQQPQAEPRPQAEPAPQAELFEPDPVEPEGQEVSQEEGNRGQFARRAALKAEQDARKAAESRAREVEAKYAQDMAKLNERIAMIAQNVTAPRQEAPQQRPVELPDINQDPIGHFQAKTALLEKQLEETRQRFGSIDQENQRTAQMRQIGEAVRNAEVEYTKTVPDYPKAQEFLMRQWSAEAEAAGMPAEQVIRARALEIAAVAGQRGMNPAELAYKQAKARGYGVAAQPAPQPQEQQQGPSLETLQRGVNASRSPSTAPGRAAAGPLTAQSILEMDDNDFAKKFGGRNNAAWEKLMGGGGRA